MAPAYGSSRATWRARPCFTAIRRRRRGPSRPRASNICTSSISTAPSAGKPVNVAAVEGIIEATEIPLQLGGGIRDLDTIETWLDKGVTRVIIGTAAVRDPALVTKAATLYPARVAVALDARDGIESVKGWAETSELTALRRRPAVRRCRRRGADLHRHCPRRSADRAQPRGQHRARRSHQHSGDRFGRAASLEDIKALLHPWARKIAGAIAGRALYDGRLDPAAALALIRAARERDP